MSKSGAPAWKWKLGAFMVAMIVAMELLGPGPITHIWRKPSREELDALTAEGDSIVRSLHDYHTSHHQYPSELPRSLDTGRGARYGGWRYECAVECTRFELSVGSYRWQSFSIWWRFDAKTWYVDT